MNKVGAPLAEIRTNASIAPEILAPKNRDFLGGILRVFYLLQNWGFFTLPLLKIV